MAVYLPQERVAIEIIDDPMSLPADLDAFPGYSVIPVTSADVRDNQALDRLAQRVAQAAGTTIDGDTKSIEASRAHLSRLLANSFELGRWSR